MPDNDIHKKQIEERKKYTDLILASSSKNKVIVAGAGTGKTFTFKSLLTLKDGKSLALTFINNLANDLEEELSELADVNTFHGYCKSLLHKITVDGINSKFYYYPKLPKIIDEDALILDNKLKAFEEEIQKLNEGKEVEFYIKRANYYNSVGHNDAVFRVLQYFRKNPTLTPKYSQIVVDEYQDFNPLEVEFIEHLTLSSPVLIAGDDDQAIYGFKHASSDHIRKKATDTTYERFELPYCSRCTSIIVSSVNNIIEKAKTLGLLENRIEKKYLCFIPEKEKDNEAYPQIIHATCSIQVKQDSRNYIGKYIEDEIKKIPQAEIDLAKQKNYFCVLIIGPSQYLKQVFSYLKPRFTNMEFKESKEEDIELLDAYRILMHDQNSNLGWRIILNFLSEDTKKSIIQKAEVSDTNIIDLLDKTITNKHISVLETLKKIIATEELTEEEVNLVQENLGQTIEQIRNSLIKTEEAKAEDDKSPSIKLATVNGSKGMSAGFVFMVGMNDGDIPRNPSKPTDHEICQFIVGLTRTRKQCYLISNKRFGVRFGINESNFISWIDSQSIKKLNVDANYFRSLLVSN